MLRQHEHHTFLKKGRHKLVGAIDGAYWWQSIDSPFQGDCIAFKLNISSSPLTNFTLLILGLVFRYFSS